MIGADSITDVLQDVDMNMRALKTHWKLLEVYVTEDMAAANKATNGERRQGGEGKEKNTQKHRTRVKNSGPIPSARLR